jgi:hypothetical protein
MPKTELVFKPKYNGSMRFAMLLWPVWVALFFYFLYQGILQINLYLDAFLAFVFGSMAVTLPFRVFREVRFGDQIVVKRYLQPDLIIKYEDVTRYSANGLWAKSGNISLQMMNFNSAQEFGKIIQKLISEKSIRLKKYDR